MLLSLPTALQDTVLQYLTLHSRSLQALDRRAVRVFSKTFLPEFFVLLTRPMRLGGALTCGQYYAAALRSAAMTDRRVCIAIDVPVDLAGRTEWPLPSRLRSILPGPREMWTAGVVVGFGMKKSRGTYHELRDALAACAAQGTLRFASLTDTRLPKHLPKAMMQGSQLEMLHQCCPDRELLAKLSLFDKAPAALCFNNSCACFFQWAEQHPQKADSVHTLGDFVLQPSGLKLWNGYATRSAHIKRIGLSITTFRYKDNVDVWTPPDIADKILTTFPGLEMIGINVEISYECPPKRVEQLMQLLTLLAAAVELRSYEVHLIQLPPSSSKRAQRLTLHSEQLTAAGVKITTPPRAWSTKEVPVDGFSLPASLWLSAPDQVCRGIDSALWHTVW